MNTPYHLLRGGFLDGSSLNDAGSSGCYWSSTPNGSSYVYILFFYSDRVNAGARNYRYNGQSVRCVAAG